jgi:hypothetical protein
LLRVVCIASAYLRDVAGSKSQTIGTGEQGLRQRGATLMLRIHHPLEAQKAMVKEFRGRRSSIPLRLRLKALIARWLDARNRYRPELHYMRGRGPKWYAKHQGHS